MATRSMSIFRSEFLDLRARRRFSYIILVSSFDGDISPLDVEAVLTVWQLASYLLGVVDCSWVVLLTLVMAFGLMVRLMDKLSCLCVLENYGKNVLRRIVFVVWNSTVRDQDRKRSDPPAKILCLRGFRLFFVGIW